MQISRFVYLKTKLKLVLCQKIMSIIHRIGVQSFILLSQSAQYFCLTAILLELANVLHVCAKLFYLVCMVASCYIPSRKKNKICTNVM